MHSRRQFLRTASAGAVGVGALVAVPAAASASPAAAAEQSGPLHPGPFVAWVKDATTGDVAILVGERELVHRDPALARRLAAVAAQPTPARPASARPASAR